MSKNGIILALLFVIMSAPVHSQRSVSASIRTAEYLERSGDLKGAIQIYSDILERNTRNLQIYWRLKELYRRSEDLEGGIALIEKHLDDFPDDIQARMDLGEFHFLLNNRSEAERIWLDLESRFGNSPVVYRQLFALFARLSEESYLKDLVSRGREQMRSPSFMSFELGNYYKMRQAIEPAVEEFLLFGSSRRSNENTVISALVQMASSAEEAKIIESNLLEKFDVYPALVNILLVELYFSTKRYQDAYDTYLSGGIDDPAKIEKFLDFAGNLRQEKEYKLALQAYQIILNSESFVRTERVTGAALIGLGQCYEDQVTDLGESEELTSFLDGNAIFTYNFPAGSDTTSQILQTAFTIYDSVLANLPATTFSSQAHFRLGEIQYLVTNQFEAAERSYRAALASRPDPDIREKASMRIGQVMLAQGKVDSALTHFSSETKRNPKAQLFFIQSVFLSGDMDRTVSVLDSILKVLPPDSPNFNDVIELDDFIQTLYISGTPENRLLFQSFIAAEKQIAMMKIKEAAELLAFARTQIPEGSIHPWLIQREAELRQMHGENAKTLDLAEELKNTPLSEAGWILAGVVYEKNLRNLSRARREYTEFLEKYPQSVYFEPVRRHLRAMNN